MWIKRCLILAMVIIAIFFAGCAEEKTAWDWAKEGEGLYNQGKYAESIQAYDKAIELDPQYVAAWNNKGIALDELGRYDEAIASYDKAIELDPQYAAAWNNKGVALDKLGRKAEAQVCFDKAKESQNANTITPPKATEKTSTQYKQTPASTQDSSSTSTWQEVISWEGKSIKNTETFHISSNEWRISWATVPGDYGEMVFSIYVYASDGTFVGVAANVIGKDTDHSIMRGGGDYYLTINTGQPYKIIIEEKK